MTRYTGPARAHGLTRRVIEESIVALIKESWLGEGMGGVEVTE